MGSADATGAPPRAGRGRAGSRAMRPIRASGDRSGSGERQRRGRREVRAHGKPPRDGVREGSGTPGVARRVDRRVVDARRGVLGARVVEPVGEGAVETVGLGHERVPPAWRPVRPPACVAVGRQGGAQLAQRVVEPRPDRPVGDAQDRGDLGQREGRRSGGAPPPHGARASVGRRRAPARRGSRAPPRRRVRSARPAAAHGRGHAAGAGGPRRARPAPRADRSRHRSGRGPSGEAGPARCRPARAGRHPRRRPGRAGSDAPPGTGDGRRSSDQELVRLLVAIARPFHQTSVHGTSIVRVTSSCPSLGMGDRAADLSEDFRNTWCGFALQGWGTHILVADPTMTPLVACARGRASHFFPQVRRTGRTSLLGYETTGDPMTVRRVPTSQLSGPYRRTGCLNAAQAAYWLGSGDLKTRREAGAR